MDAKSIEVTAVVEQLKSLADPDALAGMVHFGIHPGQALGIKIPVLRNLAKEIGKDHDLAKALWKTGLHEARLLAAFVAEPARVTENLVETWVVDFDSWDICDQVCGSVFDRTPMAYRKALEWSEREEEFVKRAGFVMMATLAIHDKQAADSQFEPFLPAIQRGADDDRNFVKKAVNWALRQIGKRNPALNTRAIQVAQDLQALDSRSARWIAADALRELTSEKVQQRFNR
jgi:3-methyladenine DNA glycosylase AlkD